MDNKQHKINEKRLIQILFGFYLIVHGCWSTRPPPSNKIVSIQSDCSRDLLRIDINLTKSFKGIIFARDFAEECRQKGNYTTSVELTLPISGCGVRSELRTDGTYEFSVRLVLQMDEKLRQSTDIETIAKCKLPDTVMSMNVSMGEGKKSSRNGRMHYNNGTNPTQRVRVWLELGGNDGVGTVEVGQPTTLAVRAMLPGNIGVRVIDCAALDGLGESSQKLLDERGCPVDEQVMPSLFIRSRPIDDGWSKPQDDDIVEKLFTATFPAFKFPDRERLHVSCGVQLCKDQCPKVNCKNDDSSVLEPSKQLARVEVFNSLSVTAPHIELDRSRTNNGNNVTVDEIQPKVRRLQSGDGILCMSTSKLALAFCILGMIFLIAVIVSICCLLRSKLRGKSGVLLTPTTSTSVFSSSFSTPSHSRFGSKLIIPYGGGSLPYGRVY